MGWFTDLIDKHTERAVRRVAHLNTQGERTGGVTMELS